MFGHVLSLVLLNYSPIRYTKRNRTIFRMDRPNKLWKVFLWKKYKKSIKKLNSEKKYHTLKKYKEAALLFIKRMSKFTLKRLYDKFAKIGHNLPLVIFLLNLSDLF